MLIWGRWWYPRPLTATGAAAQQGTRKSHQNSTLPRLIATDHSWPWPQGMCVLAVPGGGGGVEMRYN